MFKKEIFVLVSSCFLLQSHSVIAANKKYAGPTFNSMVLQVPSVNFESVGAQVKKSESKRKPSSELNIDDSMMSKELKEIISKLHKVKTSEEYDEMLTLLDKNYDSYPTDVKFYLTQILPLKPLRGIVYRLRPMFEKKSNFLHSEVVTFVKKITNSSKVLLPFDYVNAGTEYLVSPYYVDANNLVATFKTEDEVQMFIAANFIPALLEQTKRLQKLDLTTPVVWDNRIVYGPDAFKDGIGRFKLFGEFEKQMILSSSYSALSSLALTCAYNISDSIDLYKEIGFLYGLDGFGIFNKVDGVSAEKVSKIVSAAKYSNLGTLLSNGKTWVNFSYQMSLRSLDYFNEAWKNSGEERKSASSFVINTDFLNVDRNAVTENLEIATRIMKSSETEALRSVVTGEVIQVNYKELFSNPPKDLKIFLPVGFEKGREVSRTVASGPGKGKVLKFRNYAEGRAIKFKTEFFAPYFPNIKSQEDVFKTRRVLSHLQGDWLKLAR